jgi:hypothetical protein
MTQYVFGSGNLWATQTSDAYGNLITTPTPQKFGTLQDITIDISKDVKELYGQQAFAIDVSAGKAKITIKAKAAQIYANIFNSVFFGQTVDGRQIVDYADNIGEQIPATPYTIVVTPPGTGVWSKDLGVRNASGDPLVRLASGTPTTGQYVVTAGSYVFAIADSLSTVFIDYQYTLSTTGKTISVVNPMMGQSPTFSMDVLMTSKGKSLIYTFPNCVSTKLAMATKIDDYMIPEFDVSAFASPTGQVFTMSTTE